MKITRLFEERRIKNTVRIIDGNIKKEVYKFSIDYC